ncbi:MAG: methionyl-tRNA formyltransferase [Proteobacteria bacterium]|nr:methionyl-tRNA formyltransferase [Pseudomonadota bacterium]
MRIILIGQGPFGEKVLEALIQKGEEVVGVFCPPDKRGEAMTDVAERSGIPVFRPNQMRDPHVYAEYAGLRPDMSLLAFVTDIIPATLLSVPSLGTICYHPSLLPKHRGASAINWAIIQGDSRTGLTIFWVDEGIDTGPILLQKEIEIGPDDTTGSIYFNALFPMGVDAMVEAVQLIKEGKAPRIPQDESDATYEPPCDDAVAAIDWKKSAEDLYNLIRGCDPQPGAHTTLKGQKVRLYEVKLHPVATEKPPGEILTIEKGGMRVAVKDGSVEIGRLRVDKGEKVGAMEFAQSVDVGKGDRFGD